MDKYDYLVSIFHNIEKYILNFKYRVDDFYRNTNKIKMQRRLKINNWNLYYKKVFQKIQKILDIKIIYLNLENYII